MKRLLQPITDISEWPTRRLIRVGVAVFVGLGIATYLSACSDVARMNPMLKRTLDDQQRWSGGSSP